jgi:hypothetical protein
MGLGLELKTSTSLIGLKYNNGLVFSPSPIRPVFSSIRLLYFSSIIVLLYFFSPIRLVLVFSPSPIRPVFSSIIVLIIELKTSLMGLGLGL